MFTNDQRQDERTGKYGTPRLQYLQELVTQFQSATQDETREKIVANLANFAYDPYNYNFLRQLNVLELFLDCISEPNEKLVEFGIGGICNACADPTNSNIVTQCGGIPLVIQCLSSPVRNTVNYALGALYYLCNESNKEDVLKLEVVDLIKRYADAETVNLEQVHGLISGLPRHLLGAPASLFAWLLSIVRVLDNNTPPVLEVLHLRRKFTGSHQIRASFVHMSDKLKLPSQCQKFPPEFTSYFSLLDAKNDTSIYPSPILLPPSQLLCVWEL